ncbi:reverse transcriptase domain-containing protein [Artemisia annua]|uniref:Reverse transcriptase domain-containing protein n=1 Tax=Artemisia annua TaxID=35608 RepID=A0A2U1MUL6_ARTAN|nr:reverse transcriptase domain-containing protein [Artemisia annua]
MALEFIVFLDRTNYPESQVILISSYSVIINNLPPVFREDFYNGNKHAYVTSNLLYRFKCQLVKPNGRPIRITGIRWTEFCKENVRGSPLLHFIQQSDDTFYVTCYDDFGYENGFYPGERNRPERIVTRVWPYADYEQEFPIQFLPGLNHDATIRIRANVDEEFNVRVNYVQTDAESGKYKYRIRDADWNAMVDVIGLEAGMVVVFTKEGINRLHLMAFNTDGTQVTITDFKGLTMIKRMQRPLYHFEKGDKRMHHICLWPGHLEHFGESHDTFYKAYNPTIDQQRLAIPSTFLDHHPMHTHRKVLMIHQEIECEMTIHMDHHYENPTRTNHVNVLGMWKEFAEECHFDYDKMLRCWQWKREGTTRDGSRAGTLPPAPTSRTARITHVKLLRTGRVLRSFASLVNNEANNDKVKFRALDTDKPINANAEVKIPKAFVLDVHLRFSFSLCGYFVGKRVAFPQVYLGILIMLDSYTSSMCLQSWGRMDFACALIDIRADRELKDEMVMAIPNVEDDGEFLHTVRVDRVRIEREPPRCAVCMIFGQVTFL